MKLEDFHNFGEEVEKRLKLKTFPLALKFLESEADIPEGAKRPKRDLGYHLSACQAFALSRRQGETIAELKEDNWCFEPVVGYGIAEPTDFYHEGHCHYPLICRDLEAGKIWARSLPCLEVGKYVGIVSAPLKTANFEPDLVMIYCNSVQLQRLLAGLGYKEGHLLTCTLSSECACVYAVVPVMQSGECQVGLPCWGDRMRALAQDDELIFSAPTGVLEDIMTGIRFFDDCGLGFPTPFTMMPEYKSASPSYDKMAKDLGIVEKD